VLCSFWEITTSPNVVPQIMADSELVNANNVDHLGLVMTYFHKNINLASFLLGALCVVTHLCSSFLTE